ncbi:MAG: hypothetical protein P1U42_08540 [Phycisphaerales bacterium]|nr:hypothetical protein [Phycisphaerales bacterium]
MSDRQWKSSYDDDGNGDRLAKLKAILSRIFGDGENPFAWGFTLFRVFGIRFRIHLLFIVYLLSELIFTVPGNRDGFAFVWPRLVAMLTLVMIHEIAHCMICRRVGGESDEIMLWPLGGFAHCVIPDDWKSELRVALAGPLSNVILIPVFGIPLYLLTQSSSFLAFNPILLGGNTTVSTLPSGETTWWLILLSSFYAMNWTLVIFNLLIPMFPLDSARILYSLLWRRTTSSKAMWQTVNIGLGVATLVGLIGIIMQDGKILLAIAILSGIACSMKRRRLQFLQYGDSIPGLNNEGESWKSGPVVDEDDQEIISQSEVDRILAKISSSGIESLSRKERRSLKRATETSRKSQ